MFAYLRTIFALYGLLIAQILLAEIFTVYIEDSQVPIGSIFLNDLSEARAKVWFQFEQNMTDIIEEGENVSGDPYIRIMVDNDLPQINMDTESKDTFAQLSPKKDKLLVRTQQNNQIVDQLYYLKDGHLIYTLPQAPQGCTMLNCVPFFDTNGHYIYVFQNVFSRTVDRYPTKKSAYMGISKKKQRPQLDLSGLDQSSKQSTIMLVRREFQKEKILVIDQATQDAKAILVFNTDYGTGESKTKLHFVIPSQHTSALEQVKRVTLTCNSKGDSGVAKTYTVPSPKAGLIYFLGYVLMQWNSFFHCRVAYVDLNGVSMELETNKMSKISTPPEPQENFYIVVGRSNWLQLQYRNEAFLTKELGLSHNQ